MTSKPTASQLVLKITSFILRLLLNIIFYVVVIMLIATLSKEAYNFCYQIFGQVTESAAPGRDVDIQIRKGESTMHVASKLELNKVIVNKYSFFIKAKLKKYNIMPGEFTLNTSMTYDEIFAIITVPTGKDEKTDSKNNDKKATKQSTQSSENKESGENQKSNSKDATK